MYSLWRQALNYGFKYITGICMPKSIVSFTVTGLYKNEVDGLLGTYS